MFGRERLIQLGAVAVTSQEKKKRPLYPGTADCV